MKVISFLILIFFVMTVQSQSSHSKLTSSLDSLFQGYFKAGEPGGAVLIVKENEVIYKEGFGVTDIVIKEPITTKTLFNIGSISKTFVSYGILQLAGEGKLSLEDDLYKFFPDFHSSLVAKKVKLFHLLTHTSGLPDSRKVKEERDFYLVAKDEENWAPIKATQNLEFEPGTKYKYSNPAFNGLALVIEKVSGKKWQDYIAANIFKPSAMQYSTITDGPHPTRGVSHGYIINSNRGFEEMDYGEEPTFAAAGNGGVWSSVEELWKYEQAIQQFQFLDEKWITISRRIYQLPGWKDPISSRLGLSWFLIKDQDLDMIGHTGSQGGFISDYCWWPEKKIFYVLLCNVPRPIKEIRQKVMNQLLAPGH
jgi:CubicO group peptidase (beta-lactamase class C family)